MTFESQMHVTCNMYLSCTCSFIAIKTTEVPLCPGAGDDCLSEDRGGQIARRPGNNMEGSDAMGKGP